MEKAIRALALVLGLLITALLIQNITHQKLNTLKLSAGLSSPDIVSIKTREKELNCLAINIYREAGYEPFEGVLY